MDEDPVASSGTWKATKVDWRPLCQTALSTVHQLLIAASLPIRGRTGLSLQLHMPYLVSASMRTHWALRPDQMGLLRKLHLWDWGEERDTSPTHRLPTFSWFTRVKGDVIIIFGNEHVSQHTWAKRQGVTVLVLQELDTQKLKGQLSSLPTNPPRATGSRWVLWPMLEQSGACCLFFFFYIWFKHHPPSSL